MITIVDIHEEESDTEALLSAFGPDRPTEVLSVRTRHLPPGVQRQLVVGFHEDVDAFARFVDSLYPMTADPADPPGSCEPSGSTPWTPPQRTDPGTVP